MMKRKLLFHLILFVFLPPQLFAQDSVHVKIYSNDPRAVTSFSMGYSYGADFDLPSFLSNNYEVNLNLTNLVLSAQYVTPLMLIKGLPDEYRNSSKLDFSASIGLWRSSDVKEYIDVNWQSGYNTNTVVKVPVQCLKIRGLHTGATVANQVYSEHLVGDSYNYHPYTNRVMYAGYYWGKYSSYSFSVEGRYRSGHRYHESFIDLFYAPRTSDSWVYYHGEYFMKYGARLGSRVYGLRRLGWMFRFEAGIMPKYYPENFFKTGNKLMGMYGKLTFGLDLSFTAKGRVIKTR
jgi:hypothetical protein